jgi:acyl-CoA thioester hydrolase
MLYQQLTLQPNMETISKEFQISIAVTKEVLDEANHVNNVEYLRWVQEVSQKHWQSKVNEDTLKKYAWVALDHHIQYKSPAFLHEELILRTFITANTAATCTRVVEIYRDDKLITKAKTNWCLINNETQKPARIPAEILARFI